MAQFKIINASKIYNENTDHEVRALDNVSFSANEGEFIVILGASGAGKSTLLNIIGGMDTLTKGSFIIDNVDISKVNESELGVFRREKIGFVFQFYNLINNLTALENVQIAESLSKNPLDSIDVLNNVGLGQRLTNSPAELSGGEQQRVAIARAIVKNPTILLCDEPTGALDSKTGSHIIKLLVDISKKYKKTVIIVTHNSKIAEVAHRVIRLQDGKISSDKINKSPKKIEAIDW